ncbi:MAG: CHAT domain-containing protein [Candidatus Aminicenantes bacterium]|jgi:CHAT domain-containing protein/Tfp pilus assembly protein PilF
MGISYFKKNFFMILLALFLSFGIQISPHDKKISYNNEKLREDILSAYKTGGEEGILDFFKKNQDKINNKFIIDFAEAGKKEKKGEWINISILLSQESKDNKTIADIYKITGEYFQLTSDQKKAAGYFYKALPIYLKLNDPVGQGKVYLGMGIIYSKNNDNSRALEMYDKALVFFNKGKSLIGQGNVYFNKGLIYSKINNSSKELEMYDKALAFYEKAGNTLKQGIVYFKKGEFYFRICAYSKAHKMFDEALPILKNAGLFPIIAKLYYYKGDTYFFTFKNSVALEMYDKALIYYKKSMNFHGQGNVYWRKGEIYLKIGDNLKAADLSHKAVTFLEKVKDSNTLGNVYRNLGDVYSKRGKYSTALNMYDNSLLNFKIAKNNIDQGIIYRKKGDIYKNIDAPTLAFEMYDKAMTLFEKEGYLLGLGNAYLSKGMLYSFGSDYVNAIEMHKEALNFFEQEKDQRGKGNVYFGLGVIYSNTGNDDKALEMYDKALPFFACSNDDIGQANVFRGQGLIYSNKGKYEKAFKMFDQALAFYKKAGEPIGESYIYLKEGEIYYYGYQNSKALSMFEKARQTSPLLSEEAYKCEGDVYLSEERFLKALELYDKALSLNTEGSSIELKAFTLHGKAKALAKLGKKGKALELFEKGVANLEKGRKSTPISAMKMDYMKRVYQQYEETVVFMVGNNYYEKGFKYAEKMRARVFLEKLAEGIEKLNKGISQELKQKRDNLVSNISRKKREIAYETGKNKEKLEEELDKIEIELDNLSLEILQESQNYFSLYREPVELKNLQQKILKQDELLLEYFLSEEGVYLFLVSQEDFKVKKLELSMDTIDKVLKKYQNAILESFSQPEESHSTKNKIIRSLEYLYSFLLKPVEKSIEGKNIIFAPEGNLTKIPFEALVSGRDKKTRKPVFLIEKNPIKYIQSASVLALLRSRDKGEVINDNLVAFGDPVYEDDNFKKGKPEKGSRFRSPNEMDEIKEIYHSRYVRSGGDFHRLPYSSEEVKSIKRIFEKNGKKTILYLRDKATEKNAKSPEMNRFGYIHFACHGVAGDEFQSLVLSLTPATDEDGFFSFDEIMNCNYNAQLVVLSGCKTNLGKIARGEGVIGLTRAVMYAGTHAVVASLWKVKDTAATKELMVRFYKNLLEKNMDKSEALRQSKLELLNSKNYDSPIFWSAFIMYGE